MSDQHSSHSTSPGSAPASSHSSSQDRSTGPSSTDPVAGLTPLGWDARVEASLAGVPAGLSPARVVRVERGGCVLALADGDHPARSEADLAVGDWVAARRVSDTLVVETVVPRWSQLARRNAEGLTQVLAANVDLVLVTAPADHLSLARVERETVLAWDSGAQPVVLLTKSDLAEPGLVGELGGRLVGTEVIPTSSTSGEGVEQVRELLGPNRTAVLLGPSGAGKSSLVNALLGTERLAVSHVRAGDRRGRHTTTARQLLTLPTGGVVIDMPGLRSLSLAGSDGEGIAHTFSDIEDLAEGCRFADCRHEYEPGCAVTAALDGGELDAHRVANYRKLQRELDYQSRRDDPVARREAERVWKMRTKASRQLFRERAQRSDRG